MGATSCQFSSSFPRQFRLRRLCDDRSFGIFRSEDISTCVLVCHISDLHLCWHIAVLKVHVHPPTELIQRYFVLAGLLDCGNNFPGLVHTPSRVVTKMPEAIPVEFECLLDSLALDIDLRDRVPSASSFCWGATLNCDALFAWTLLQASSFRLSDGRVYCGMVSWSRIDKQPKR